MFRKVAVNVNAYCLPCVARSFGWINLHRRLVSEMEVATGRENIITRILANWYVYKVPSPRKHGVALTAPVGGCAGLGFAAVAWLNRLGAGLVYHTDLCANSVFIGRIPTTNADFSLWTFFLAAHPPPSLDLQMPASSIHTFWFL